jgi:hypothetical protein
MLEGEDVVDVELNLKANAIVLIIVIIIKLINYKIKILVNYVKLKYTAMH